MGETIKDRLAAALGGRWRYRGFVGWDCDDGRTVRPHGGVFYDEYAPLYWKASSGEDVTHLVRPDLFPTPEAHDGNDK